MRLFDRFLRSFRRTSVDADVQEEQQYHRELLARDLEQKGLSAAEARRQANVRFGSAVEAREETRRQDVLPWLEDLGRDLRLAFRGLLRSPSYSAVVFLALALGIGANTAIYSVVHSVLIRELPYSDPERLAFIYTKLANGRRSFANYDDLRDWAKNSASFRSIAAYTDQTVNLTGTGEPDRLRGGFVSHDFFETMGVAPAVGRPFTSAEVIPNGPRVAIASWGMWQERFGGRPDFLNSKILLNGEPYVVVGVMPRDFDFPFNHIDVWMPYTTWPPFRVGRASANAGAVGRLKTGISMEAANQELNALTTGLAKQFPDTNSDRVGTDVVPLRELFAEDLRPLLMILTGAVLLALLVACANVATLNVSRVLSRMRELGIRAALGAGSGRLMAHLFSEQLLLSLGGGLAGLVFASWFTRLSLISQTLPDMIAPRVDWSVAVCCLTLALVTAVVTGLAPAWFVIRGKKLHVGSGSRSASETGSVSRMRQVLVTLSVAVSVVLLAGAGLLVRSFNALASIDPGFNPAQLLTLEYRMPQSKYPKPEQQVEFHRRVAEEVSSLPGVRSASVMMALPFSGNGNWDTYSIPGRLPAVRGSEPRAQVNRVDPRYFETMEIKLLRGRVFTSADGFASRKVAVISRSMAEHCWPGEDPLDRQIALFPNSGAPVFTVVGVVADSKHRNLQEESGDKAYVPFAQQPHIFGTLAVRVSAGDPSSYSQAVRQAIWRVDRDQPVWKVRTMDSLIESSVSNKRGLAVMMSAFSGFALLLATLGLYGVISYTMARRTKELGIRAAMGATHAVLVRSVLAVGLRNIAIGMAVGLACAIPAARVIKGQMFEVQPSDPKTYLTSVAVLLFAALLATLGPVRRVLGMNPSDVLRQD